MAVCPAARSELHLDICQGSSVQVFNPNNDNPRHNVTFQQMSQTILSECSYLYWQFYTLPVVVRVGNSKVCRQILNEKTKSQRAHTQLQCNTVLPLTVQPALSLTGVFWTTHIYLLTVSIIHILIFPLF